MIENGVVGKVEKTTVNYFRACVEVFLKVFSHIFPNHQITEINQSSE